MGRSSPPVCREGDEKAREKSEKAEKSRSFLGEEKISSQSHSEQLVQSEAKGGKESLGKLSTDFYKRIERKGLIAEQLFMIRAMGKIRSICDLNPLTALRQVQQRSILRS